MLSLAELRGICFTEIGSKSERSRDGLRERRVIYEFAWIIQGELQPFSEPQCVVVL